MGSRGNVKMEEFGNPWFTNVIAKYEEVRYLVYNDDGPIKGLLVDLAWQSNGKALHDVMSRLIVTWGNSTSADQLLDDFWWPASVRPHVTTSWLQQFREQTDAAPGFARDIYKHMSNNKAYELD